MEYLGLSPYAYRTYPMPMRNVGWLGAVHGLPGGADNPLTDVDAARLRDASWCEGGITLGYHRCEFCPEDTGVQGNGEYRYYAPGGNVYSAPTMILHYVDVHGYRPPAEFMADIGDPGERIWDWRADRLLELLLDDDADFAFRVDAITDLPNWPTDPRGLDAILRAAENHMLAEWAGMEFGAALAVFLRGAQANRIDVHTLPANVRLDIQFAMNAG